MSIKKAKPGQINIRFKEMLDVLKEKFGNSRVRIAVNLAVDRAALTHLVSGRTKAPSGQTVRLLGDVYGVSAGWLHDGAGEMFLFLGRHVVSNDSQLPHDEGGVRTPLPGFPASTNNMTLLGISQRLEGLDSGLKVNSQLLASVQEMVSLLREVVQSQTKRIEELEKAVESLIKGG